MQRRLDLTYHPVQTPKTPRLPNKPTLQLNKNGPKDNLCLEDDKADNVMIGLNSEGSGPRLISQEELGFQKSLNGTRQVFLTQSLGWVSCSCLITRRHGAYILLGYEIDKRASTK
jgi:hypothetical protein